MRYIQEKNNKTEVNVQPIEPETPTNIVSNTSKSVITDDQFFDDFFGDD